MGSRGCCPLGLDRVYSLEASLEALAALVSPYCIGGNHLLDHRLEDSPSLEVGMEGHLGERLVEHLMGCKLVPNIAI